MAGMRRAWLLLPVLVACASPEDEAAYRPLACGEAAAGEVTEVASFLGNARGLSMGECGHLSWTTPEGDVVRLEPGLEGPETLATAAAGATLSQAGDQLLLRDTEGGVTWRRLPDGEAHRVEASAQGFARLGDRELAWACGGGEIGVFDEEGFTPLVDDVATCAGLALAPGAPVLLYVGPEDLLRRVRLDTGASIGLPEVPFIAVRGDQLSLSRDGRLLVHRPVRASQHVGLFDLEADERFLGAIEVRSHQVLQAGDHTLAIYGTEGAYVVTPDGWVNLYEGGDVWALSEDGERALIYFEGTDAEDRRFEVATLDDFTSERLELPTHGVLGLAGRSEDGGAVVIQLRTADGDVRLFRGRWTDGALEELTPPGLNPRVYWVADDGATLVHVNDDAAALVDPSGEIAARFANVGTLSARATGRGALLQIRDRDFREQRLIAVRGDGTQRTLFSGESLQQVLLDRGGARVAFTTFGPDEADPTMFRTTVWAGAPH